MTTHEPALASDAESVGQFTIHEDDTQDGSSPAVQSEGSQPPKHTISSMEGNENPIPLVSDRLGNIDNRRSTSASKKLKLDKATVLEQHENGGNAVDTLLAKLSAQQAVLEEQKKAVTCTADQVTLSQSCIDRGPARSASPKRNLDARSPSGTISAVTGQPSAPAEVERLRKELNAAKDRISKQEQELTKTRVPNASEASVAAANSKPENTEKYFKHIQGNLTSARPTAYISLDDGKSDVSDVLQAGTAFGRGTNTWDHNLVTSAANSNFASSANIWAQGSKPHWMNRPAAPALTPIMVPSHQAVRSYSGSSSPIFGNVPPFFGEANQYSFNNGTRRYNNQSSRSGSSFTSNRGPGWSSYGTSGEISPISNLSSASYQPMGLFQAPQGYQPRPIGTPLSPTAAEFPGGNNNGPWNASVGDTSHSTSPTNVFQQPSSPGQTFIHPLEPLNYRKLLDRSVSCNWKYIVDKIVCNNDQQASIFLQQKLKVGTAEQKYEIVEAIVAQAYPLMVNRFGNFLVQRCFEHGTPEQVVSIANAIRGNTLSLSMDAFGCHVVQKAFDAVPEEYKAIMVHELLRRIPETVIHRYACHVWQKLFELRWSDSPPQIMKYVNEALRGMWHEVALGETGSLVVQNIFENCLEEDKRPCIDEVLNSIDIVAHGQFGNWCIQHVCEHGAPADRSRAIDHVLRYATEYSMDQFASKVVEKCLKIGGSEFLERYLERVCEGRHDRPRIPLIDIASDQYGNYLIQYILTHAGAQHREIVASHIRKHMVSLRGSKFGSRVGLLCCNPAYATRPGPAVANASNRFNSTTSTSNSRFGGTFR